MKRLRALIALAGVLALAASAQAQENRMMNPDCNIICSPVFVLQPAAIITNFIDAPTGVSSSTDFLARFTTAIPTAFNPLFLVALVQWTPAASIVEGQPGKANAPAIVYGPGLHVLGGSGYFMDMGSASRIFALDLLPLIVYSPSGDPANEPSSYTHKLVLEADLFILIGQILDRQGKAPYLQAINLFVILDYLTSAFGNFRPEGTEGSDWVMLIGGTLPVAPIPGG